MAAMGVAHENRVYDASDEAGSAWPEAGKCSTKDMQAGHVEPPSVVYGFNPGQQGIVTNFGNFAQQAAPPLQLMAAPQPVPGVPPGLEYLLQLDQLLVHQQVGIFDVIARSEGPNIYQIKNSIGQLIYTVTEESGYVARQLCIAGRDFIMHVNNNFQQEVIRVKRDFRCCEACVHGMCCTCCTSSDCCSTEICVEAPVGQVVGYIKEQCTCSTPTICVQDAQKQDVLMVKGDNCGCYLCYRCYGNSDFEILTSDSLQGVGKISKLWSGCIKDFLTNADHYSVSFPMDLDVRTKATLLGALFFVDFSFYAQRKRTKKLRRRRR